MYIGPWQEYALYKSTKGALSQSIRSISDDRSVQSKAHKSSISPSLHMISNNSDVENLRLEFQRALLSSLDAATAQKALLAMNPLLESMQHNQSLESTPVKLPLLKTASAGGERNLAVETRKLRPNHASHRMHQNLHQFKRVETPNSTRSEPLPQLVFPEPIASPKKQLSSVVTLPHINITNDRQPPYNAQAVISTLRMERAKLKKEKEDLSKKLSGSQFGLDDNFKPTRKAFNLQDRISQLNKMKENFINKSPQDLSLPTREAEDSNISVDDQIVRPVIEADSQSSALTSSSSAAALEYSSLTSRDLVSVSKYFKNDLPSIQEKIVDEEYASARLDDMGAFDELYINGPDGLINWSLGLNLDIT